ncbi:hypothetical protein ACFL43_06180, partial [Thermodesulfobacteriota bacterium]
MISKLRKYSLMLCLAEYLRQHSNQFAWLLFALAAALGLYTVPTMLYPFAMVAAWLGACALFRDTDAPCARMLVNLAAWCAVAGLLTLAAYTPVFLGSGIGAVVSSDYHPPLPWPVLLAKWQKALAYMLEQWTLHMPLAAQALCGMLLAISLICHRRMARHRIPVILSLAVVIAILLLQRLTPYVRTWLFLLPLCIGLASAGAVRLLQTLPLRGRAASAMFCASAVMLSLALGLTALATQSVSRAEWTGT